MIEKNIEAIDKSDIEALISNGVNESKTLEYKEALPSGTDADRKEFLYDVSSFANASGGDIIFGVNAATDDDGKKTGAPKSIVSISSKTADEAKLWLENVIRDGIEPRLTVQIREVVGWNDDGKGYVILIRIPKSIASPHMVTLKGASRFYSRNSAGKYPLDVHELRTAFLATESQGERINRFRQERLAHIVADEIPVVLSSPHRLVLHMIPLGSFLRNDRLDFSDYSQMNNLISVIGSTGCGSRYNLDGFVTIGPEYEEGQGYTGYCQIFFNGAVEVVSSDILSYERQSGGEGQGRFLASVAYEQDIIQAIAACLRAFAALGVDPPVAVLLSLLGCRGAYMYTEKRLMSRLGRRGGLRAIDRDAVILPDAVVDSLDAEASQAMKPVFDAVWNACGYPCSLNYDEAGNWKPR